MGYVALKPIVVGMQEVTQDVVLPDGTTVAVMVEEPIKRMPGEPVPEAAEWPDPSPYLAQGMIQYVPDEMIALIATVDQLSAEIRELKATAHTHNPKPKNEQRGQ